MKKHPKKHIHKTAKSKPTSKHGTIIQTGITCKKIPLLKSIEFDMALK